MARIRRPGGRVVPRERETVGQTSARSTKPVEKKRVEKRRVSLEERAGLVEERGLRGLKQTGGEKHGLDASSSTKGVSPLHARFGADEDDAFAARLGARGTKTISTGELAAFHERVLGPLSARTAEGGPSAETWSLFQRFAALDELPSVVEPLREGLKADPAQLGLACARAERALKDKRGAGEVRAELRALRAALEDPGVDALQLGLLVAARGFAAEVEAQLPGLPPERRQAYFAIVHDLGYADAQLKRAAAKDSPLCPFDDAVFARLPAALSARFAPEVRAAAAGEAASMPRLNLQELVDEAGPAGALAFLQAAGKDIDAKSAELGGRSLRALVDEGPEHGGRLEKHQVLNAFARGWSTLRAEADDFGPAQRAFLDEKQAQGVVPALLMVLTPGALERALAEGAGAASDEVGAGMHALWTALQTGRGHDDPLIAGGYAGASAADREKNAALFGAIVNHAKTRVLSGLADRTYDQKLAGFLADELGGDSAKTELLTDGVRRFLRDADPADPLVQAALGEVGLAGEPREVMRALHELRFNPSLFRLESVGALEVGGRRLELTSDTPVVVGATNAGFRVKTPEGEALLWLPKGARFSVEDGALKARVTDAARFADTSARLLDHDAVAARNGLTLTDREVLEGAGFPLVLERGRTSVPTGEAALNDGYALRAQDVDRLVDTYVRGLTEVDEARGRKFGVLYELGPDNWVVDPEQGLMPSYLDVAFLYRTERDRDEASFFSGGYGAAANWIAADAVPMSRAEALAVWRGEGLDAAGQARLKLFRSALDARLDADHPVWRGADPEVAARARATLRADLEMLA